MAVKIKHLSNRRGRNLPRRPEDRNLLNRREAAEYLGISVSSLAHWSRARLGPVLEKLSGDVVLSYVDDICSSTSTEAEAQANKQILGDLLKDHPAGPLFMKCEIAPLGKPIDFLGYRVRRRQKIYGGGIRLTPSPKSFCRFEIKLSARLKEVPKAVSYSVADDYRRDWSNSFGRWERSSAGDDLLFYTAHHVINAVKSKK